jgi:hypothetical protein
LVFALEQPLKSKHELVETDFDVAAHIKSRMHGRSAAIAHKPVYICLSHVPFHVFIIIVVAETVHNVVLRSSHDRTVMAEA